ncbi:MAG: FecR domain-containing protein [Prolixibacteraceae bacterium]
MAQNTPWHTINKYFEKTVTDAELAELHEWLGRSPENEQLLAEAYDIYAVSDFIPRSLSPDHGKAWAKIDHRIALRKKSVKSWFGGMKYTAAAVAVFFICVSSFLLVNNFRNNQILTHHTEIVAPLGQKTMVVLPDGSEVWLNSGSSLRYEGNFNLKEREVILTGEAYFEVQKDKSKKFTVITGTLRVDVYGTAFNIKNYKNDEIQEITVSEGRVGISDNTGEIKQLTRGEQVFLDKRLHHITFGKSSPEIVTAWKNNELIFDNTPMEEVIKYLQRWYGVSIMIENASKRKPSYTFKVKTESLREMLGLMKVMTPFEYEINGKNVKIRYTN